MDYRKLFIPLFIIIVFIFSQSLFAIGIEPLTIDLTAKPGDTIPFSFKVIPSKKSEQVAVFLNRIKQELNGSLSFTDINPDSPSAAKWIDLPNQISISPEVPTIVKGTVKIPLNTEGGTYLVAVMVQTQKNYTETWGVNLRFNFAIRLKIKIDYPGLRPSALISDFSITKGTNGEPDIRALAKNTSPLDFPTSATVTIRNSQRRLLQRMNLKTEVGWNLNAIETTLFPGSELLYYGQPTEALLPGQYEIRLFYQYGSSGQILKSKIINVQAGDYVYPAAKLKAVKITPSDIDFAGRPGTVALKALRFENKSDKPVDITVELADVYPDYAYSILSNTDIELRGGKKFRLEPRCTFTNILKVKFRKDAPIQVNYGMAKIKVYSTDLNPILLENSTIPLSAAVIGAYKYAAEVTNILGEQDGDKYLLSMVVKNTGSIKISPTATIFIKNAQGVLLDTVKLAVEGDDHALVYPDKVLTLTGFTQNLAPGKYSLLITINEGNKELGSSALSYEVNKTEIKNKR